MAFSKSSTRNCGAMRLILGARADDGVVICSPWTLASTYQRRLTPQFSGRTLPCEARHERIMKWRARAVAAPTCHGPLQLLVRRQRDAYSTPAGHRQSPVNPHAGLRPTSGLAAAPITPSPTAAALRDILDTAAFLVA